MTRKILIDIAVSLNYYRSLIKDKHLKEDMRKAFNFLKDNKEVLYNLSIDELANKSKEKKFEEYSCLALERLFYYPPKEISDFGEYDSGKEKIKRYSRLKIISSGVNYEFNCERINKLNNTTENDK